MDRPKLNQNVYLKRKKKIHKFKVVKVGRKYFYIQDVHCRNIKVSLETWCADWDGYDSHVRFYNSKKDLEDYYESCRIVVAIKHTFSYYYKNFDFSIEELREIEKIIIKNKEKKSAS